MSSTNNFSNKRRSSNCQDAAGSTAEMAVQTRPLRSTLKALEVRPVLPSVIQGVIEREHYLHSMPAASRRCFGVYLESELVGAVVFTSGPRQAYRLLVAAKPQDTSVLARLWLSDALPTNSESRVIGIVIRLLQRSTQWKLLISYADPASGHVGTIYQATGWLYLGMTEPNSYVTLSDGKAHHPRSIYNQFGSNSVQHLRATGVSAVRTQASGKYRYAYVLQPSWRWRLRDTPQTYPSKQKEEQKYDEGA